MWLHDSMGTFTNGGMVTFLDEKNDQAQKAVQIRVVLGRGLVCYSAYVPLSLFQSKNPLLVEIRGCL